MKRCLPLWLLVVLLLYWPGAARATALSPPAAGRPLAEALNPDGTLRAGANGSFDARAFRMRTAPDGRPVFRPAGTAGAGDERWQNGFGLPDGTDGEVTAVAQVGGETYICGSFRVAGNVPANGVAKWNGSAWTALGTGVTRGVYAMNALTALAVAANGDVYVGGNFTQAGGVPAGNVARWDGTAWRPLGTGALNGTNAPVDALAVAGNGDVYAGGFFTQAGGVAANSVARWNGTSWNPLGTGTANGIMGEVSTLAIAGNGDVYVGGGITQAGGTAANGVARWNGSSWSPLGTGLNAAVRALAIAGNGDVYVGGIFTQAGGMAANGVARWNGSSWSPLGTGVTNSGGGIVGVYALAVTNNGDVYAGGNFTQMGGIASGNVARWTGTTWSPPGTGVITTGNVSSTVYALAAASNGDVFAGGVFTQAGGPAASNVAKWSGTAWSPLRAAVNFNGLNLTANAVAVAGNGDVYVGGSFTQAGGTAANGIAKWNGTAWSALGTGTANGVNGTVYALAVAGTGEVYVGGQFAQAGGQAANGIAKWNGTAWSALGTGVTSSVFNAAVFALAVAGSGEVYVGGQFAQAGGMAASNVARWNGTTWNLLGIGTANGVNGTVYALAVAGNGEVYVGGYFGQAGGAAAYDVAKWNGTAWSPLGTGITNGLSPVPAPVYALAIAGTGEVYAGGAFNQAGGAAANGVAKWNGSGWSPLGTGTNATVSALGVAGNGDVYQANSVRIVSSGVLVYSLSRWDGNGWNPLGTGISGGALALAFGANGKLYVGGDFTATGDGSKVMAHFGIYDPAAPLAATAAHAAPAGQLFPNPAHGTATLRLPAGTARQPLTLHDALGRLVRQYPAPAGAEAVLDLRGLPAGVYVVRGGELSQRLVVE